MISYVFQAYLKVHFYENQSIIPSFIAHYCLFVRTLQKFTKPVLKRMHVINIDHANR